MLSLHECSEARIRAKRSNRDIVVTIAANWSNGWGVLEPSSDLSAILSKCLESIYACEIRIFPELYRFLCIRHPSKVFDAFVPQSSIPLVQTTMQVKAESGSDGAVDSLDAFHEKGGGAVFHVDRMPAFLSRCIVSYAWGAVFLQ